MIQSSGEVLYSQEIVDDYNTFEGFINALNQELGTSYNLDNLQKITIPNLAGENIKETVGSYELIEMS